MDALRADGIHYDVTCAKCGVVFRIQTHEIPNTYVERWSCPNIMCRSSLDDAKIEEVVFIEYD